MSDLGVKRGISLDFTLHHKLFKQSRRNHLKGRSLLHLNVGTEEGVTAGEDVTRSEGETPQKEVEAETETGETPTPAPDPTEGARPGAQGVLGGGVQPGDAQQGDRGSGVWGRGTRGIRVQSAGETGHETGTGQEIGALARILARTT